jgi:hypothetical protein
MNAKDLQAWLGAHGQPVIVDGKPGAITRAAIRAAFTSNCAPAVADEDIDTIAARLACSARQIRAVAAVESGGGAFDKLGRPKMLFERHLFHRLTRGVYGISSWSDPEGGGYAADSWEKLTLAACRDVDAAFMSASWGRFQVLGMHWLELGYPSPLEMAYSTVTSEAAHYEMLARFIEHEGLKDELRALSTDPETCRAFAKAFNGPKYTQFNYHNKLSRAMA